MSEWVTHLRDWSGVISLIALVLLWATQAMGFEGRTTGSRLEVVENRVVAFDSFMQEQKALNTSLKIWMCVGDYDSAVLAQVRCRDLGIDRLEAKK